MNLGSHIHGLLGGNASQIMHQVSHLRSLQCDYTSQNIVILVTLPQSPG